MPRREADSTDEAIRDPDSQQRSDEDGDRVARPRSELDAAQDRQRGAVKR